MNNTNTNNNNTVQQSKRSILIDENCQDIDISKIENRADQSGFNCKDDYSPLCKKLINRGKSQDIPQQYFDNSQNNHINMTNISANQVSTLDLFHKTQSEISLNLDLQQEKKDNQNKYLLQKQYKQAQIIQKKSIEMLKLQEQYKTLEEQLKEEKKKRDHYETEWGKLEKKLNQIVKMYESALLSKKGEEGQQKLRNEKEFLELEEKLFAKEQILEKKHKEIEEMKKQMFLEKEGKQLQNEEYLESVQRAQQMNNDLQKVLQNVQQDNQKLKEQISQFSHIQTTQTTINESSSTSQLQQTNRSQILNEQNDNISLQKDQEIESLRQIIRDLNLEISSLKVKNNNNNGNNNGNNGKINEGCNEILEKQQIKKDKKQSQTQQFQELNQSIQLLNNQRNELQEMLQGMTSGKKINPNLSNNRSNYFSNNSIKSTNDNSIEYIQEKLGKFVQQFDFLQDQIKKLEEMAEQQKMQNMKIVQQNVEKKMKFEVNLMKEKYENMLKTYEKEIQILRSEQVKDSDKLKKNYEDKLGISTHKLDMLEKQVQQLQKYKQKYYEIKQKAKQYKEQRSQTVNISAHILQKQQEATQSTESQKYTSTSTLNSHNNNNNNNTSKTKSNIISNNQKGIKSTQSRGSYQRIESVNQFDHNFDSDKQQTLQQQHFGDTFNMNKQLKDIWNNIDIKKQDDDSQQQYNSTKGQNNNNIPTLSNSNSNKNIQKAREIINQIGKSNSRSDLQAQKMQKYKSMGNLNNSGSQNQEILLQQQQEKFNTKQRQHRASSQTLVNPQSRDFSRESSDIGKIQNQKSKQKGLNINVSYSTDRMQKNSQNVPQKEFFGPQSTLQQQKTLKRSRVNTEQPTQNNNNHNNTNNNNYSNSISMASNKNFVNSQLDLYYLNDIENNKNFVNQSKIKLTPVDCAQQLKKSMFNKTSQGPIPIKKTLVSSLSVQQQQQQQQQQQYQQQKPKQQMVYDNKTQRSMSGMQGQTQKNYNYQLNQGQSNGNKKMNNKLENEDKQGFYKTQYLRY